MFKRVDKVVIGKGIDRSANFAGAKLIDHIPTAVAVMRDIAPGEIVVLDSEMIGAWGSDTIAPEEPISFINSPSIYIVEGTDEAVEVGEVDPSIYGPFHKLLVTGPIEGKYITKYVKRNYVDSSEAVAVVSGNDVGDISGIIVAGREFLLSFTFEDLVEHPSHAPKIYRYVCNGLETISEILEGLATAINEDKSARISASYATNTLTITGKPIIPTTSSVTDIDEYSIVDFNVVFNYVDNEGNWTAVPPDTFGTDIITYTPPSYGIGTWEMIRDVEKHAQSYLGVDNRIWFPILTPEMRTEKDKGYNMIIIESDPEYRTADNQYSKDTPKSVMVAIVHDGGSSTTHQGLAVEDSLDTWINSIPHVVTEGDASLTWG